MSKLTYEMVMAFIFLAMFVYGLGSTIVILTVIPPAYHTIAVMTVMGGAILFFLLPVAWLEFHDRPLSLEDLKRLDPAVEALQEQIKRRGGLL